VVVGTAAYPPGALIHAVPPDVVANGGRVFWVADPADAPPPLPAGYHSLESRCVILACLTIYGRPAVDREFRVTGKAGPVGPGGRGV